MVKKIFSLLLISFVIPPFASAQIDTSDSLTITTYYPSPYGVYGTLKLQPKPRAVTCREGEMTYSDNSIAPRGLYYCNDTQQWVPMGAGGVGYWAENSTSQTVYNTNTGNVGINTDNAVARLQVHGTAILGAAEDAGFEAENCRISTVRDYFAASVDALFIEKADDDPNVEGGIILGFANSTQIDTPIDSPGWAVNHMPVLTLRGATGNVGIGTTNPYAKLDINGSMKLNPIDPAVTPVSNTEGVAYYDSTLHTPRYRDATQWNNFISEYGSVTFNSGETLKTVNFRKWYSQRPFVIATPAMIGAPADGGLTVSIRQLTNTSAQFDVDVVDEWDNDVDDTVHQQTEVHYIVIPRT